MGGDVESNVSRWVGQFQEKPTPIRKEFTLGNIGDGSESSGTFTAGAMMGETAEPKPNYALLAMIVEAGGTRYFSNDGARGDAPRLLPRISASS